MENSEERVTGTPGPQQSAALVCAPQAGEGKREPAGGAAPASAATEQGTGAWQTPRLPRAPHPPGQADNTGLASPSLTCPELPTLNKS